MSGDVHVRFRERLGGRFPGAPRLIITGSSKEWLELEVKPSWLNFWRNAGWSYRPKKPE